MAPNDTTRDLALLNLAVVARMMLADGRIADEEREMLEALLAEAELDDAASDLVRGWSTTAPVDDEVAALAVGLDPDARRQALSLAWVVALSDGDIDPEEEATYKALAVSLAVAESCDELRSEVESGFYGSAMTVIAGLALMAHSSGLGAADDAKRSLFAEVLADSGIPEPLASGLRGLLVEPPPLHSILSGAASLAPDFQEALLGNLWAMAWADGDVDAREKGLFARFEAACGVPRERVLELQIEWGAR
jgi:uncharacterized tellurite resistance protein B-like protein